MYKYMHGIYKHVWYVSMNRRVKFNFKEIDSFIKLKIFIWLFVKTGIETGNGNENIFELEKSFYTLRIF